MILSYRYLYLEGHIALEKSFHEGFEAVKWTVLCNYYKRAITLEPELFQIWLNAMLKCHDYAFYTMSENDVDPQTRPS